MKQEEVVAKTSTSLYGENLKFGAMPTHPLGTSTVFHAGVIGKYSKISIKCTVGLTVQGNGFEIILSVWLDNLKELKPIFLRGRSQCTFTS